MSKLSNIRLTSTLLFFVWASLQNAAAQNTYALVIGLSKYQEITPLQFADRDAVAFAEFLKTQQIPDDHIKILLNENATRLNVLDGMYNLTAQLKPKDRFYFYFGGHGDLEAQISSENSLLLLYNSFKKNYFQGSEFIQLFELKEWLGALAKKQIEVVFIADACHSGGLIGGKEGVSKTQTALNENWAGITKILSCKSDEFSLEGKQWGGGRGLFSYHLVNGLTGRADANKDKNISLSELDNYLKINVVRQANPNVQTPVIIGNAEQQLSVANTEGLKKLAELEQKNFALLTEVNIKGDEKRNLDDLAKLDTTIVETYKRFAKALKEKRIAPHDDSLDCALFHYKKLETYKLPDNLAQMIKRNMAVGLMDMELAIMKDVREKGIPWIEKGEKITVAIRNLEETMNLFGSSHHIYKYLQARVMMLKPYIPQKMFSNSQTVDDNLRAQKESRQNAKESFLKGLILEPNMISTYILLSSIYRSLNKPDSAIYYQEKVVKLLPNQAWASYNLGQSYSRIKYKDANGNYAIHPKAIEYLEKAVELDSTFDYVYEILGDLCIGATNLANNEVVGTFYQDFSKAIPYFEKMLSKYDIPESKIPQMNLRDYSANAMFEHSHTNDRANFSTASYYYKVLYFLYQATGNETKSEYYLNRLRKNVKLSNSFLTSWEAGINLYILVDWEQKEVFLKHAFEFIQQALNQAEVALKDASVENKPFLSLQYRELLKAVGTTHLALKNFTAAENFYKQAIGYPVLDNPINGHLKLTGGYVLYFQNRMLVLPNIIVKADDTDYHYRIDAYTQMILLKLEENKPEEALNWYEKALQVSITEHGNDTSGKPFTTDVLRFYKNLNKEAFLKLRYKYFPDAEKVD